MRLSRDPVIYLSLFATAVRLVAAFFTPIDPDQQAWLNAGATALAGVVIAIWVRRDGQVAALLGFAQAILALGVGFGWNIDEEGQAVIMSFVGTIAAMFTRTQVTAPVSAEGARVPNAPTVVA